ncbi:MAG TPA: 50S ribosomal protein L11 methyltransferase [Bacteroidales bacterium]|nr:50S ribosomal protein L11 methyltransferase [Bacteroidales bacterium]
MEIKKGTLLRRTPNLTIELQENRIKLKHKGKSYYASHFFLAILDVFASPKTFEQGVAELEKRIKGVPGWLEATSHIIDLHQMGVLEGEADTIPPIRSEAGRFDSAEVHIRMLNDYRRTLSYKEAIAETVKPGDVVLDIGTGTGVLAMMAARAGAKMVYAVEREPNMASLAEKLFEKNQLHNRIQIICGKSTEIELPGKADVMISEIVGNDPLAEGIIPTTNDALHRLLKPDARLIPGRLRIYALPLSVPQHFLGQYLFKRETVKKWKTLYGIDFSYLAEASGYQMFHALINTNQSRKWKRLAEPVLVAELDLCQPQAHFFESKNHFEVLHSGVMSGVLLFFELRLSASVSFSIHPDQAKPSNSWSSRLCIPGSPVMLEKRTKAQLLYSYSENTRSQVQVLV